MTRYKQDILNAVSKVRNIYKIKKELVEKNNKVQELNKEIEETRNNNDTVVLSRTQTQKLYGEAAKSNRHESLSRQDWRGEIKIAMASVGQYLRQYVRA